MLNLLVLMELQCTYSFEPYMLLKGMDLTFVESEKSSPASCLHVVHFTLLNTFHNLS